MRQFVAVTKALGCEKRLRILMALRNGELCEGVINEMLGLSPATTSRHLWVLREAGLVDSEKTGRCICYRLAAAGRSTVPGKTLRWLDKCLAMDPQIAEDAKRAQALSGSSSVQAECCERRERLAQRWVKTKAQAPRKSEAAKPNG
jgi:DNA-binding transcriptional ArsR family regulator